MEKKQREDPEDQIRKYLEGLITDRGTDMADVSRKIERDPSYVYQYIKKKTVLQLPEDVRERLGVLFSVHPDTFRQKQPELFRRPPREQLHFEFLELDVRAGAGNQQLVENDGNNTVGTWSMPRASIEGHIRDTATIRIIQVVGDSMAPELYPGDRIMVNLADRTPSPPGLFVVWDGLGLVVKRCQSIPNSDPPRIKLSSANKEYDSYELLLEECHINGRVIGRWQWT